MQQLFEVANRLTVRHNLQLNFKEQLRAAFVA